METQEIVRLIDKIEQALNSTASKTQTRLERKEAQKVVTIARKNTRANYARNGGRW